MALLEIKDISISYKNRPIVKNFSLTIDKGEVCSIVGESGSGKTTVIRAVFGLLASGGKVVQGDIIFEGKSIFSLNKSEWKDIHGKEMTMIFQDLETYSFCASSIILNLLAASGYCNK